MKELLEYLVKGLLGDGNLPAGRQEFEIMEASETGRFAFTIKTAPENVGLIIGKGGHMIKSIRNVLKVRATLEKVMVSVDVG
jgi:predicted RNA-binding protein YlqC (UPF0109 family)